MTQIEKKIKIAEACGWKSIPWSDLINPRIAIEQKHFCIDTEEFCCLWLPNYFESLDACREMERIGYRDQPAGFSFLYNEKLKELTAKSHDALEYNWSWHASAATKAEAFGQTLKLW
jgi:hypothetical protein